MALGATQFNAPAIVPDFSAGMPMVTPVQVLPAQEAKSPIDTFKEVFFDIRDGIKNLVDQSKEALVLRLRNEGQSYRSIREQTGLALSTIRRIILEGELT